MGLVPPIVEIPAAVTKSHVHDDTTLGWDSAWIEDVKVVICCIPVFERPECQALIDQEGRSGVKLTTGRPVGQDIRVVGAGHLMTVPRHT